MKLKLYALNDFAVKAKLKDVNSDGEIVPLTTGVVTAFISTGYTSTATAADPSLNCAVTHIGDGFWLIKLDAAVLTASVLGAIFTGSTVPYLIIQQSNGIRVYAEMEYLPSRKALIAS